MINKNLREGYQPTSNNTSNHPKPSSGHQPTQKPSTVSPPPCGPGYKPQK